MIPQLLAGAGLVALAAGLLALRGFGPGYRIGRSLAAAPAVTVAEAIALARSGRSRFVQVRGRVDATEEFEDEHGRPLVLRRVRLERRDGGGWRPLDETRRTLPFGLSEGLDTIAVDVDALDAGLVVIARESIGRAGEAPEAFPADLDPATVVRLRIEQVSAVDHAIACGVPSLDAEGRPRLGPGLGRPLILTTLERDDALRLLAGGSRGRALVAGVALALGATLLLLAVLGGLVGAVATITHPPAAYAASPAPSGAPDAGDTRSTGDPPGFIGAPLLAIGGVLAIGLASLAGTLLWIRLTGGTGPSDDSRPRDGTDRGADGA